MTPDDFSVYDYVAHPVFVLVADANNLPVYKFLNKAWRTRFGGAVDQAEGVPAYDIFEGRAGYSIYRHQCLAWSRGEDTEYEVALPIGDSVIWTRTKVLAVRDAHGAVKHMVGTSQDITAEREQSQAHAMAVATTREMGDLVCFAAHDLRSPIANLKSLAVLMRKNFVDLGDGKADLINMIDDISDKALGVVSSIMGQVMAVGAEHARQTFELGQVCDDIMVMLDPTDFHSAAYPRRVIQADQITVHIALRNLIDNAIKHAGQQALQIVIDVAQMNAERLVITVTDTGPGISPDAFNHPRKVRPNDHAGFGLAGIERLLRSRGGQMIVMPQEQGKGAEIMIELPGRMVDAVDEATPPLRIA